MNKSAQILVRVLPILICFISGGLFAQKEHKVIEESFKVEPNAIVNINTTHTDIEFITWDKNEVAVEATIVLEGATPEEAVAYFDKNDLKIMGNSRNIEISTRNGPDMFSQHNIRMQDFIIDVPNMEDILIKIPQLPELAKLPELSKLEELTEIVVVPPIPPLPPMEFADFDYESFKKDGEKYLKKWKKEFSKNFDENYEREMQEWANEMEDYKAEIEERREELRERRQEVIEANREKLEEKRERQEEKRKAQREVQREVIERRREAIMVQREVLREQHQLKRNITNRSIGFYSNVDGGNKGFKIKRTIKIKMPKSVKLKMNVRHGEVKLAENTKNIQASLSYASLHGSTIGGSNTLIKASYSPVSVQKWNGGQLNADFSENISLKEVRVLNMKTMSSNVIIDKVLESAQIENNMGSIVIGNIANNFKNINISVEHGEIELAIPSTSFAIVVSETGSVVVSPDALPLKITKSDNVNLHKAYQINKEGDKAILVNAEYSKVVLRK